MAKKHRELIEPEAAPKPNKVRGPFELKTIIPLTDNQQKTFDEYTEGKHLLLHGFAGTGKTFISIYLALDEIKRKRTYKHLKIIRSIVPSRDIGFLPGGPEEKQQMYERPYVRIINKLYGREDAYQVLTTKKTVQFDTTSFLRGDEWDNSIIVVDEIQNMTFQELDTVITRVGDNCKIIFCGDFHQSDLMSLGGLDRFMEIIKSMYMFSWVEFNELDIVRGELVKRYIIAREAMRNGDSK